MLRRAPPSVGAGSYNYRSWWAGGGGGGVEAGMCTESLGSESGDVGCDAAEIDYFFPPVSAAPASGGLDADVETLCGAEEEDEEVAVPEAEKRRRGGCSCFPPAMPRAMGALVLRAERSGGRLILTEVRADEYERRVVFRAQRDAGRLRLRFADDDDDKPEAAEGGDGGASAGGGGGGGGVAPVAVQQHAGNGGGGGGGGGELCQVAAGAGAGRRGGMEVGTVMMGTI